MTADDVLFTLGDGRYEVLDAIGAGGMATVHRCRDLRLGVERAIKVAHVAGRPASAIQRCLDEARAMASVDHPAILPAIDAGIQGQRFYLVMPLASESLASRVKREGPIAPRAAAQLMIQILGALHAAHTAGFIHRDVKPENILLDQRGSPMLADFGVALVQDREDQLTLTGVGLGTWSTMAPEQRLDAHRVGPSADVYAAAATLFHLVTAQTPLDLFAAVPTSPRWEGVPPALLPLLQRATALDIGQRPASAAAFAKELTRLKPSLPAQAPPSVAGGRRAGGRLETSTLDAQPPLRAAPPPRSMHQLAGLVVVVTILPLCLGLLFLLSPAPHPPPKRAAVPAEASVARPVQPPPAPPIAEVSEPTPAPSPRPPAPATEDREPAVNERPTLRDAEPSPDPRGPAPALPVHGQWTGAIDGRPVRVNLAGHADALRATFHARADAPVQMAEGAFHEPDRVDLEVAGASNLSGRWRLASRDGRLEGTVERPGVGEIVPVTLRRTNAP